MTDQSGVPAGPVRIELATSELEGGRHRAWADPARVLTVIAVSTPEDSFAKIVEPRLRELEDAETSEIDPTGAPPALRGLLDKLREAHARLWRDNQSLMRERRLVELSCILAEEDRVYFVKGAPAWACLLRKGRAYPAGQPPAPEVAASAVLGRNERLGLEVTSMAVRPGDTVVLFASDSDLRPDLHAVQNLFHRTPDLKRACDGLVNLLGLQAQGACAVALRFVPVCSTANGLRPNPLDTLVDEWNPEVAVDEIPRAEPALPASASADPGVSEPMIASATPSSSSVRHDVPIPAGPTAMAGEDESGLPGFEDLFTALEGGGGGKTTGPAEEAIPERGEPVLIGAGEPGMDDDQPKARLGRPAWLALLGVIVILMAGLVALPRTTGRGDQAVDWMTQVWRGAAPSDGIGVLVVAPQPAARGVYVDGHRVAGETPARLDSIPAGRRHVTLDLGPCGTWEGDFTVPASGTPVRVAPRLTGSVSILAADAAAGGRAWIQGREKLLLPAVFDSMPAGWNRVFYEDDNIAMWDRMVLVKPDQATRVVVPNEYRGGQSAVRVEALRFQGRDGLVASEGDTVRIDGRVVGVTPIDLPLAPGLHSVRVSAGEAGSYAEVLAVKAGGARCVLARLGEAELPTLRHVAPGRVYVRGPILLTVEMTGGTGEWTAPTLQLPELPPGLREIPTVPVEGNEGVFVGRVNPESVPLGHELRYYFSAGGPDGQTAWSDLYVLRPEPQWARGNQAAPAPRRPAPGTEAPPLPERLSPETSPPSEEVLTR